MITNNFPEYGSKEYHERALAKQRLVVDIMSAGMADIFAKRDRYTPYELGDMAKLYYDAVEELETTQKNYDNLFENEDKE